MLALSFTIVLELVPGDIGTLSPINPSDPILAISLLMNFVRLLN
jgi:hypothetical protein